MDNNNSDNRNKSDKIAAAAARPQEAQSPAPVVKKPSGFNRLDEQTAKAAPTSGSLVADKSSAVGNMAGNVAPDAVKQIATPLPETAARTSSVPAAGFAAKTSPSESLGRDRKAGEADLGADAAPARRALAKGSAVPGGVAGDRSGGLPIAQEAGRGDVLNEAEGVLVVDCIIRPEAARSGAFGKLLAKNQITFEGARQFASQPEDASQQKDSPKQAAAEQDAAPAKPGRKARAQFGGQPVTSFANSAKGGGAVVPVYVEASRQQIQATLAEMQQDREEFIAIRVQPAANAQAQQPLLAYNRAQQSSNVPLAAGALQPAAEVSSNLRKAAVIDGKSAPTNSPEQASASPSPPSAAPPAQAVDKLADAPLPASDREKKRESLKEAQKAVGGVEHQKPSAPAGAAAANTAQSPANSVQSSPAPAGAKPTMRLSLGIAKGNAAADASSRQLSADPLMASQAAGMAGASQPPLTGGVVHFESQPVQIVTRNQAADSQLNLRVLFLLHMAEPDAAATEAPPTPAAAPPTPKQ